MDNTPFLFVFNTSYRNITYSANLLHPNWQEEFSIYYGQQPMRDNMIVHELMHQYGAVDLYDLGSEGVEEISEQIFPDSVMLKQEGTEIDELTAYLIGWIDDPSELSDDTLYFLTMASENHWDRMSTITVILMNILTTIILTIFMMITQTF